MLTSFGGASNVWVTFSRPLLHAKVSSADPKKVCSVVCGAAEQLCCPGSEMSDHLSTDRLTCGFGAMTASDYLHLSLRPSPIAAGLVGVGRRRKMQKQR